MNETAPQVRIYNQAIVCLLLFFSHFLYAQSDSISTAEVNSILNVSHLNLESDSIVSSLEVRSGFDLSTLHENLILYSFQKAFNLTQDEIKSIENRAVLITIDFFKQGRPIKIFKEGGVGGGGKTKVEKSPVSGIMLFSIFLSKTDVRFEEDVLEDKLIEIINHKTMDLINNRQE